MSRDALVVGINTYDRLAKLRSPAADAEAIAQRLLQYGNFRIRRLPEIVNSDGSLSVGRTTKITIPQLEEALVQLFKPEGKTVPDTALLFFSGHGLRKDRGIQEGFLATSEVNLESGFYGLSLQWLRRLLQESPVRQQIVWLDCCHSGELLNFDQADPGDRGQGRDRCFIAASREYESAYEETAGDHGVLTGAMLQALDPDRRKDGQVTNFTLTAHIEQTLKSVTQRPLFANSGNKIILTGRQAEARQIKPQGICPYKALDYFDCNDQDPQYFYGRTALTDALLEKVREGNFVAVVGASGSGKSSVVRAGLVHQLKLGQRLSGSNQWDIYIFRPGEHPLQTLAETFLDPDLAGIDRANQLRKAQELIHSGAIGLTQIVKTATGDRVVVVIDQFEECFTVCRDPLERQQFFECLMLSLADSSCSKLCIVLTLRADFFGKCLEQDYAGLAHQIEDHLVAVTPMTREELEQAIAEPAKQVGLEVEEELITQIITDVEGAPGSLPLLQYTLTELWQHRSVNWLTFAAYNQLGGVRGTLQQRAEEVYNALSAPEQAIAKQIFLELTQLGEGTEDTRRQVSKRDLITSEASTELLERVIQCLSTARLIVTTELREKSQSSNRVEVVDVAHEALIRHWFRLRQWIEDNRIALGQKREIEAAAEDWLEQGKPIEAAYLLQGSKLFAAEGFQELYGDTVPLSSGAQALIHASQQERDRLQQEEWERQQRELAQQRRAKRWAQITAGVAIAATVLVTTAATGFLVQRNQATQRQISALTALSASRWSTPDQLGALVAAVEAGNQLHQAIAVPASLRLQTSATLWQAIDGIRELNRLEGHSDDVLQATFDATGETIVSISNDETMRLWRRDGTPISSPWNESEVSSISAHPQQPLIVIGSANGTVKLWDLNGQIRGHLEKQGTVTRVSFSPDGNWVAIATAEGNLYLWQTTTTASTLVGTQAGSITQIHFSPDGQTIAAANADGTVKLWSVNGSNTTLSPDQPQQELITDVSVTSNYVAASIGNAVYVWDSRGKLLNRLEHTTPISSIAISPDEAAIAIADESGAMTLWRIADGSEWMTLTGHGDRVESLEFSADGRMLLTASADNTVRLWQVDRAQSTFSIGDAPIRSVSISPNGETIAAAMNQTVQLLDRQGTKGVVLSHATPVTSVQFSPDGAAIATASEDGTIHLWNLDGTPIQTIQDGDHPVYAVRFSSDSDYPASHRLAAASADGVQIWSRTGERLNRLNGHQKAVYDVDFSPDNRWIVTASADGTAQIWNQNGEMTATLTGHEGWVNSVRFSPNGKAIATASADGTVRLWDLHGKELVTLAGHTSSVNSISFSEDGSIIASSSDDNTVRLWSVNGELLNVLPGRPNAISLSSIQFNQDTLIVSDNSGHVMVWNLNLDSLLSQSCEWLRDYLTTNPNLYSKRFICSND